MTPPPLDTGTDWRRRWSVLPGWRRLHRVSEIVCLGPDDKYGDGVTVCGQRGPLTMPGILSRMGCPRCAHCCDALGIPRGDGAPFNSGIDA